MIGHGTHKDTNTHLLKFAPKETNIDDSMNRCLHMNAAGYRHDLPSERGNTLEMNRHTERTSTPIDNY